MLTVESIDPDEATREAEKVYYPNSFQVFDRSFGMSLRVAQLGALTAGILRFASETKVTADGLDVGYHVNVGLNSAISSTCGSAEMVADPQTAAVFQPVGRTTAHGWHQGDERMLCLKIDRAMLEAHLLHLAGHEVHGHIRFAPTLDLRSGLGAQWWQFARLLTSTLQQDDATPLHPVLAHHLSDSVMTGLLLAGTHQYQELLHRPVPAARPAAVRRAVDFMHRRPGDPLSVTDIAAATGMSVRTLQEGFARHLGTTPMRYLSGVRLDRARSELAVSSPEITSASTVANDWGFSNYGRFTAAYRRRFGESPADTLRRT